MLLCYTALQQNVLMVLNAIIWSHKVNNCLLDLTILVQYDQLNCYLVIVLVLHNGLISTRTWNVSLGFTSLINLGFNVKSSEYCHVKMANDKIVVNFT